MTRFQPSGSSNSKRRPTLLHKPPLSYGVSVLEFPPGETHWKHTTCPYQRHTRAIESVDQGALYYRQYFYGQGKQEFEFGYDTDGINVLCTLKNLFTCYFVYIHTS